MTTQTTASAATVVEWMRSIPSELRSFEVTPTDAAQLHGVGGELLEQLLDLGMPAAIGDGVPRFDARDLENAALHLGLRSVQRWAMESWRKTLEQAAGLPAARYRLAFSARCDAHDDAERFDLLAPPGERHTWTAGSEPLGVSVELPNAWPSLPAGADEVAAAVSGLHFFEVPPPLRDEIGFARETRLAGCGIAAQLIVEECRAHGLEARPAFGLLLSRPYATPHVWTELAVDAAWVPFDPHLLTTLARHAGLDAGAWPPTRSPGAILVRLADWREPLATHDGHLATAKVRTRIVDAAA